MRIEVDGGSPTVVLGSLAHGPRRNNLAGRQPIRFVSVIILGAALICAVVMVVTSALGVSDGGVCRQNISDIRFDILRECLAHLV